MKIGVVIPSYRVKRHILNVLAGMPKAVHKIYVIDDLCPEGSGKYVMQSCRDRRVTVLFHRENRGVGGATITGYRQAMVDGCEIAVKVDGDGQMDPGLILALTHPIVKGKADYVKGNRFYDLGFLRRMPTIRLLGNGGLSFVTKLTTGYWDIMDPTNGFTAIHTRVIRLLPLDKIDNRYFFESDMLFRLSTVRAVVADFPMYAHYGDEKSNMKISRILFEFPPKYAKRFFKRIFYNYFLRDFNIGSINLIAGSGLLLFGLSFGFFHWQQGIRSHIQTPVGTVMLAVLPIILGFQMLLSAINYDMASIPRRVIFDLLPEESLHNAEHKKPRE